MSVLPTRIVNLTAPTTDLVGVLAAIYADMLANSTWTITDALDTVPGTNPGSFSAAYRNPTGDLELNVLNDGSQAVPSATIIRLGINPDGSADPIVDSGNPSGSAANFSGTDDGFPLTQTIQNPEFILVEWADALMILFKNATRTTFPNAWHFGKIWQQPIPALENTGDLRLDGNCILSNLPNTASGQWASNNSSNGAFCRRRIKTGQGIHTVIGGLSGPWAQAAVSQALNTLVAVTASSYVYGGQQIVWPVCYRHVNSNASDDGWLAKYLRLTSPTLAPYSFWRVGGDDQYMVIGTTVAASGLCIPILPGFDPIP